MKAAVGTFALGVGAGSAALGATLFLRSAIVGSRQLAELGRRAVFTMFGAAVVAVGAMEWALVTHDFSIKYVANNNARATPLLFTISGLWAALEGSILLWSLILCGFALFMSLRFASRLSDPVVCWAHAVALGVGLFFFALMLGPANPFVRTPGGIPLDGAGPNPLLQNHPLMAFHPPILYLGYVGMTVPFSFAVAALVTGRFGEGWLADVRRATLVAWGFLTAGIVLGAWWSYEVLGWGGFWAWDPVENAAFLPWLTGTAFIHSVMVQERRAMLRVWNLSLIVATFSLTIFGTFLTRSGVLNSVHAFSESDIGPWLLAFFGAVTVGGIGLIAWRGDALRSSGTIDSPVSRESAFLVNNLLFGVFAFVVLLGTVFPLIVEATSDRRLSVGEPYFNTMSIPIGIALLFFMSVAPALPWRQSSASVISERLFYPSALSALVMVGAVVFGVEGFVLVLVYGLGAFGVGGVARQFHAGWRARRRSNREAWVTSAWRMFRSNPRTYGGLVAHVGVILMAVGIASSGSSATQRNVTLSVGESAVVAEHRLTFLGTKSKETQQKNTVSAEIQIEHEGKVLGTYAPSVSTFPNSTQAIGTPSVRTGLWRDIYLTIVSSPTETGKVTLGVGIRPMMIWIWGGGGVLALGTALALLPALGRSSRIPDVDLTSLEKREREVTA